MARVLVVDDNALIRKLLAAILEDHGMTVAEAENGKEALKSLASDPPDVLITDYYMPEMDGAELIKAIRSGTHGKKDLPIIALAGSRHAEERTTAAGASLYLPKPLREKVVLDAVNSFLRRDDV